MMSDAVLHTRQRSEGSPPRIPYAAIRNIKTKYAITAGKTWPFYMVCFPGGNILYPAINYMQFLKKAYSSVYGKIVNYKHRRQVHAKQTHIDGIRLSRARCSSS